MKRYNRATRFRWKRLLHRQYRPYFIAAGAVLAVILLLVILSAGSDPLYAEDTPLYSESRIVVGVVAGDSPLAREDASGNLSGFEVDLARALLERAYPDKPVVFRAIDSQLASYLLKTGEIDLALGMFSRNVTKTQGLVLTDIYFLDSVHAFVSPQSGISTLGGVQGKRVYAMTSECAQSSIAEGLEQAGLEVTLISSASYPDAEAAILAGEAAAVLAPRYKLASSETLRMVEPQLCTVGYRMLLWKDGSSTARLLNQTLDELRRGGSHEALMRAWGIEEAADET